MKTTSWSLALVAGASSALAGSPGDYINLYGSSPPSYDTGSSEASPVSSTAPAGYSASPPPAYSTVPASSASPVTASSSSVPPYGYSSSAGALSSSAVGSGCTTTYESTCVETSTLIYNSVTSYEPYTITHHIATTYSGECPSSVPVVYSSSAGAASTSPAAYSSSPAGHSASPAASSPSETAPVVYTTVTKTNTKTVCPCETAPTRTPGEVYTTVFTTEYETTCPGNAVTTSFTFGQWTSIYTKHSLTTTTDTITTVVTHPGYPASSPTGYTSPATAPSSPAGYSSSPAGYSSPTASSPAGYSSPAASSPAGYSSPAASSPATRSSTLPPYPWSASSTSAAPTGTSTGSCVPCEGQPGKNPEEWCGYTINDNWYEVVPKTCRTVTYNWDLEQVTIAPDGVERMAYVINGQMPGPTIEANWGDEIVVHLTSKLPIGSLNGTSLHFHGIRQNRTNEMDGVSSITQCPIAPGHSMTYRWRATSYGTSWWHSHYALQTYEGMFGPMIIHGPAADVYDDEQFVALQDWNHIPVDTLYGPSQLVTSPSSGPQTLDTGLINGMNVWQNGGKRFEMTVQSGKSYRLRLLNAAIQSTFVFYVDQHELEVIAMDFVPIHPYTTNTVVVNIGQRYDVILKANQPSGDYWMRSDNQLPCGNLTNSDDIKGIVHYADGPNAEPTSQAYTYAPTCLDEPYESLVPIVPWDAGSETQTIEETTAIGPYQGTNLFKWTLSGTTFYAEWDHPTLKQIYENNTIPTTSGNLAIPVDNLGEWVYIIIDTPIPLPHPIHLHGHDFLILAQGLGSYSSDVPLNLKNPPRRDVAIMPADPTQGQPGYLVLAFYTSNPGVWLLHCHIGWHNAMGFALQIIENLDGIADTIKYGGQIEDTCAAWTAYATAYNVVTNDSGV